MFDLYKDGSDFRLPCKLELIVLNTELFVYKFSLIIFEI